MQRSDLFNRVTMPISPIFKSSARKIKFYFYLETWQTAMCCNLECLCRKQDSGYRHFLFWTERSTWYLWWDIASYSRHSCNRYKNIRDWWNWIVWLYMTNHLISLATWQIAMLCRIDISKFKRKNIFRRNVTMRR